MASPLSPLSSSLQTPPHNKPLSNDRNARSQPEPQSLRQQQLIQRLPLLLLRPPPLLLLEAANSTFTPSLQRCQVSSLHHLPFIPSFSRLPSLFLSARRPFSRTQNTSLSELFQVFRLFLPFPPSSLLSPSQSSTSNRSRPLFLRTSFFLPSLFHLLSCVFHALLLPCDSSSPLLSSNSILFVTLPLSHLPSFPFLKIRSHFFPEHQPPTHLFPLPPSDLLRPFPPPTVFSRHPLPLLLTFPFPPPPAPSPTMGGQGCSSTKL